jgi:predicted phage tail protein
VSANEIDLTWTTSTDDTQVAGYIVQRCQGTNCTNFVQIANAATTAYYDTGLALSTTYTYEIAAIDASGNVSGYSTTVTASTQANADTQPPSAPTGLSASVASGSAISLIWSLSSGLERVTSYFIEQCQGASCTNFSQVGAATTTAYTSTGLTALASYSFRVRAVDAAGNLSAYSNTVTTTVGNAGSICD